VETVVNEWLQRKIPISGATEFLKIHTKMGEMFQCIWELC
jgi:hypothetical protein